MFAYFVSRRCQVLGSDGATIATGWVRHINMKTLAMSIIEGPATYESIPYTVAIQGETKQLVCTVKFNSMADGHLVFDVVGAPKLTESTGDSRLLKPGNHGLVKINDEAISFETLDISPNGLGIKSSAELPVGSDISFALIVEGDMMSGRANVRYCRSADGEGAPYRVGLFIVSMDRLCQAKWKRVSGPKVAAA